MCIRDRQYTVINNVSSCLTYVQCGVPQGSILGPLLFLLYVNDVSCILPGENVKLFADDTKLFIVRVDVNVLKSKCNCCIETCNWWFSANRLHTNADKTNVMVFPKTKANEICVKLCETTIKKVRDCRYLGFLFMTHLPGHTILIPSTVTY